MVQSQFACPGFRRASRCVVLLALAVAAFAPATANATAAWQTGPLQESQDVNCITGDVEQEAGTYLSYYADPSNPPQVGQTYYVAIDIAGLGDPCSGGAYTDVNMILPANTVPAITAANPVRCFFKAPNSNSYQNVAANCPQSLQSGAHGYSLDPTHVNPPFWQIVQGDVVEVQVPVVSSALLNGSSQLYGYVQFADGQEDPILAPNLSVIVNPAGAQNVSGQNQQIGVVYASPSITSNAQQPDHSATAAYKGFVQNNSNAGHAYAQVAYADAAGDCVTPGATVITTMNAALQSPQTQLTGPFTGLYADVAYCWRLVATVTSGAQAGTYQGNWQYFITAGTYYSFQGEPAAADAPPAATGCTADGHGCATSNCATGSGCTTTGTAIAGHELTAVTAGTGSGTVTGGGITCPGTCSASELAAKVTLTATAAGGSTFTGWSGGGCSGTATCTVTMSADASVTATFSLPAPPVVPIAAPAPLPLPLPSAPVPPAIVSPSLVVHSASAKRQGTAIDVLTGITVSCPAGGQSCPVALTATISAAQASTAKTSKKKPKPLTVGRFKATVAAGKVVAITFKLSTRAAALLKRHHKLKVTLTGAASTGSAGPRKTISRSITISEPSAKKRKHGPHRAG